MRRSIALTAAALLALPAIATTHGEEPHPDADHPCFDEEANDGEGGIVYADTQQVWFHEGETKVNNFDGVHPWDTNPPDRSVQDGAGAGALSNAAVLFETAGPDADPARTFASFGGAFEGCADLMIVDLYSFDPTNRTSQSAGPGNQAPHVLEIMVTVDGEEVWSASNIQVATEHDQEFNGFGPNLNRFAIDLGDRIERRASKSSSAIEVDGPHEITMTVQAWFGNTGHSVYVWDTTEVPSGITFNPTRGEDGTVEGYPIID